MVVQKWCSGTVHIHLAKFLKIWKTKGFPQFFNCVYAWKSRDVTNGTKGWQGISKATTYHVRTWTPHWVSMKEGSMLLESKVVRTIMAQHVVKMGLIQTCPFYFSKFWHFLSMCRDYIHNLDAIFISFIFYSSLFLNKD